MPKFDLALLGKVDIPEENSSAGEEDEIEEQSQGYNASNPKKKKSDKPADEGTPEWEKVMVYDLLPQGLSQKGVLLTPWSTKNTYFGGKRHPIFWSEFFLNINYK